MSPLPSEHRSIGAWAGLLMAATVAAITGPALLHPLERHIP